MSTQTGSYGMSKGRCLISVLQARAEPKTAMFRHLGPNEYQTLDFSPLKCRCVEIKPSPRNHLFLLNLNFETNRSLSKNKVLSSGEHLLYDIIRPKQALYKMSLGTPFV